VTDACADWDQTVRMVDQLADAGTTRRAVYATALAGWPVARKVGTVMEPSMTSALPLARRTRDDRSPEPHRRRVGTGPLTQAQATTAMAVLLHRYTGQTALVIGHGSDTVVQVTVTAATIGGDLAAAVAA